MNHDNDKSGAFQGNDALQISATPLVECENLVKIYKTKDLEVLALQGLDLIIEKGEMMAIIGNSGSGKSTLLNMLGGLDRPSAGKLVVDGKDLLKFSDRQLIQYKLETVGFVWQNNARNLIPYLTALENVEMPLIISRQANRREKALELLELVGLSGRKNSVLGQLSGGEQQRVAISIALANQPKLLLADEPTGSVDNKTAARILDLFRFLNRSLGITIIIVTHDRELSRKVDRVVAIRDGRTSSEFVRKSAYLEELGAMGGLTTEDSHVELAVLDKTGRLQIPREYLDALGLTGKNKIRVEKEGNRIVLYNPGTTEKR
jgi:ABC-type lipoprotein export system ATPase subunit